MATTVPSFDLTTSLRWDPSLLTTSPDPSSTFYLPSLHRDRLLSAARHFSWPAAVELLEEPHGPDFFLSHLKCSVVKWVEGQRRAVNAQAGDGTTQTVDENAEAVDIRILLSSHGTLTHSISTTPPIPIPNLYPALLPPPPPNASTTPKWTLILDTTPTPPSSYTQFKTTARAVYDAARTRANLCHPNASPSTPEVLLFDAGGNVTEGSISTLYFFRAGGWVTPAGGQQGTTRRWALEHALCMVGVVRMESLQHGETVWVSNGVRGFGVGVVCLHGGGSVIGSSCGLATL
ncbi:MAG: hypothetical protein M1829_002273 [Trizodia sp. TS-e1964]|nr:MAG: hypothetical protein M1829_002273 [Trizodia sp. TS-e1964]